MSFIAPNMSKVVGPTVAAKLIGRCAFLNGSSFIINYRSCRWSECIVKDACVQHPGKHRMLHVVMCAHVVPGLFCCLLAVTTGPLSSTYVQVLGQQKKSLSGFSSAAVMPHTGFVYFSEIVQSTPMVSPWEVSKIFS